MKLAPPKKNTAGILKWTKLSKLNRQSSIKILLTKLIWINEMHESQMRSYKNKIVTLKKQKKNETKRKLMDH